MSIDVLQEKIRKLKNPFLVDLTLPISELPPQLLEQGDAEGYGIFCCSLIEKLRGIVPGVRISVTPFALLGKQGMKQMDRVLSAARHAGMYILLEAPQILSPMAAQMVADVYWGENSACDGLILPIYPGSDCIKPFLPACRSQKKSLFCVVRTSNKSAPELQDLLTGTRLVHTAAADLVSSLGGDSLGKSGYAQVGVMAGGSSMESLRSLRSKYPRLFLLIDDVDYSCCNNKICGAAFDKVGHGAAICVGPTVSTAWKSAQSDGADYLDQALAAVERMKKNISRYVTVL